RRGNPACRNDPGGNGRNRRNSNSPHQKRDNDQPEGQNAISCHPRQLLKDSSLSIIQERFVFGNFLQQCPLLKQTCDVQDKKCYSHIQVDGNKPCNPGRKGISKGLQYTYCQREWPQDRSEEHTSELQS